MCFVPYTALIGCDEKAPFAFYYKLWEDSYFCLCYTGTFVLGNTEDRKNACIADLSAKLASAAFDYQLCLPPYFSLILRAFSTIEGIALKVGAPSQLNP